MYVCQNHRILDYRQRTISPLLGKNHVEKRRTFQIVFIGDDVADAVLDPKGDRCDHAVLLDGSGEFVEGDGIEVFPGLVGIRLEIGQGHVIKLVGHIKFELLP